jgi:hypothetical protein
MSVAFASALIAYKGAKRTEFRAGCYFQIVIHQTPQPPQTTEQLAFANKLSQHQVSVAVTSGVYAQAAKTLKLKNLELGRIVTTGVPGEIGSFVVGVFNRDAKRATLVANTICDQFVATIKQQRANEINGKIKVLQSRLATIQSELTRLGRIPKKKLTIVDLAQLRTQREALLGNSSAIASILTLPPDDLGVLTRSGAATRYDPRSLSKNVFIALVGGLLASFITVLIGEMVSERRRRLSEALHPD